VEAHRFKVATAAGLVAIAHNARITVDVGRKRYPVPGMPDPSRPPEEAEIVTLPLVA
jgi:hypothetical protein